MDAEEGREGREMDVEVGREMREGREMRREEGDKKGGKE